MGNGGACILLIIPFLLLFPINLFISIILGFKSRLGGIKRAVYFLLYGFVLSTIIYSIAWFFFNCGESGFADYVKHKDMWGIQLIISYTGLYFGTFVKKLLKK